MCTVLSEILVASMRPPTTAKPVQSICPMLPPTDTAETSARVGKHKLVRTSDRVPRSCHRDGRNLAPVTPLSQKR